jgi:transcription elongation factor GreB
MVGRLMRRFDDGRSPSIIEAPAAGFAAEFRPHGDALRSGAVLAYNPPPGPAFPDQATAMNKAFTKESEGDVDDDLEVASPLPAGARNYMTPGGFARLSAELDALVKKERPALVSTVAWAAGNGDRSENGDYIYGKKRLREIDRRIRFLIKRLDAAEVVDPAAPRDDDAAAQVFFGATVTVRNARGEELTISIVGVDEIDSARGHISWVSPMARAVLKAREGDTVTMRTPGGVEELEIVAVRYETLSTQ